VLKTLLTAFQREIKATYENCPDLSQQYKDRRHHSFHSEFLLRPYHTTSSRKFRALKMRGGEFFSHSAFSLFIIIFSLQERRIWASTARLRRTKFIFRNPILISFPMLHAHSRNGNGSVCACRGQWLRKKGRITVAAAALPAEVNEEVENSGTYRNVHTSKTPSKTHNLRR
jgi:hypothetical protein